MRSLIFALALILPAAVMAQSTSVAVSNGQGRHHSSISTTVAIGQTVRINRARLRPVAIVEDSRCPRFVTCVWRGRLVVRFSVAGRPPITLENEKPVAFAGGRLTLEGATPVSGRGEKVPPARYRFQLRYER